MCNALDDFLPEHPVGRRSRRAEGDPSANKPYAPDLSRADGVVCPRDVAEPNDEAAIGLVRWRILGAAQIRRDPTKVIFPSAARRDLRPTGRFAHSPSAVDGVVR